MPSLADRLPRALGVLEEGIAAGEHVGVQVSVRHHGVPVVDDALGLARPGVAMTTDSLMAWLSLSKIPTSVAFLGLWERGLVALDDPVVQHVPEFAAHGKDAITLRHLITHTCGLQHLEQSLFAVRYANTFDENVAAICAARPDPDWLLGRRAAYQTTASMLLLAEIIHRLDGRTFDVYVREELFLPLGMPDCWIGMPKEPQRGYGDRLGITFDTSGAEPSPRSFAPDAPDQIAHVIPGGSGRGPMRQLVRLLELLRLRGELDGVRLLSPQTVDAMIARHRCGLYDESWNAVLDWGLGLTLDSKVHHSGEPHLYGYGSHASPRSFGHSGFRTAVAFCDPDAELSVACVWNGMVADDVVHSARQNRLCDAVYEDLDLVG